MFDVTFGNVPDYRGIGIYCITNTKNQKQYVGQSIHVQLRFKQHIHNLSIGKCGKKFIDDIKNGAHFEFSILERIESPSTKGYLCDREWFWSTKLNTVNNGYNGYFVHPTYSPEDKIYTDE